MAKKEVKAVVKVQAPGGMATPAPPIGPALGQHGVNIGMFVKQFNDATKDMPGMVIPAVLTVYTDRSFDVVYKTPPASVLIKKAAGIPLEKKTAKKILPADLVPKGKYKPFKISKSQLRAIAEKKLKDMNAHSLEAAFNTVCGTARSMGVEVTEG